MKKVLSLILICVMVLALASGCAGNAPAGSNTPAAPAGDAGNAGDTGDSGGGLSAYDQAIADRTQTVKLKMAALNWTGTMPAQAQVAEEMNKITREKLNIEVELLFFDMASYQQQITLMLGGGEQLDLFNAIVIGFTNSINNGYLVDLEENDLIQNYGPDIIEKRGQDLDGCRFNGTLYGVPVHKDDAAGFDAYVFGAPYLDKIGFQYESGKINSATQDDIERILADLHTAYPDKAVIVPQTPSMMQTIVLDQLGGDFFGDLVDPVNSLKVTNLFEDQKYFDFCNMWYQWNQKGYVAGDALTNEMAATAQVRAGSTLGYKTSTKPGVVAQESNLIGMEAVVLQVGGNFKRASTYSMMPWTISINTVDSVAAMQYLNELYSNPELSRLYCWGREGSEYVVSPSGHLTFPEGVTSDTSGYMHNVCWELPNQFIAGVWEGDELTLWDDMQKFNDEAPASKAMGFTFDNSAMSSEYTAINNIYLEYQKQLEFGFLNPEVGIPEMVSRMESAGLSKYIAEKQSQLDAWAASVGLS